jgi:cell division protein FtsI (penicillin-binding protein 3)
VQLARFVHSDPNEILARMKASHAFAWVARKVDSDTAARIRAADLRGIYFTKEPKRFYPKRDLAAQVLGYVGMDDEGLSGIERVFDDQLHGMPGKMLIQRDARGRYFGRIEHDPQPGQNIALTLDEKIQYIAERELERAMHDTHAEAGTVIVENPQTGEILALANRPTFNPNNARTVTPAQLKNRAVSDIYEPGSTFKIVTIAGALEERLTRPEEIVDCQMGSITINGMRIRDHKAYGLLSIAQVIENSSDVGAIKIGMRLGEDRFDSYIRKFGFGSQTGIELPGETRGLTKPVSRWSKVSIGAISMGQEIGISAVQLIALISAIGNEGQWISPRIVADDAFGKPDPNPGMVNETAMRPATTRRVISARTAEEMKRMLQGVVLEGTGRKAQLDGYTSAGKTGTAQKVDPATGAYSRSKYVASFAGFAPADRPAVAIAVILDSPVGLHEGGQVAAPVFQRIAQQVLPYLNVPRDTERKASKARSVLRAKVTDRDLDESSPDRLAGGFDAAELKAAAPTMATVEKQLKKSDIAIDNQVAESDAAFLMPAAMKTSSRRERTKQKSKQQDAPLPNSTVVLDVEGGVEVPSFVGKPLRTAVETAQEAGLELQVIGSGVGQEQTPAAGSHVLPGSKIVVRFSR